MNYALVYFGVIKYCHRENQTDVRVVVGCIGPDNPQPIRRIYAIKMNIFGKENLMSGMKWTSATLPILTVPADEQDQDKHAYFFQILNLCVPVANECNTSSETNEHRKQGHSVDKPITDAANRCNEIYPYTGNNDNHHNAESFGDQTESMLQLYILCMAITRLHPISKHSGRN